jgi:hypothetical protein
MKTTLFPPLESHGDPINNLHLECYGLASSSHKGFSEGKKREKRSGIFEQFMLK